MAEGSEVSEEEERRTQADGVLAMLKANPEGITALDVLKAGYGMRAAARISDLRGRGYVITTYLVKRERARVALYKLREEMTLW
jgi:hypothetical protein